MRRIVLLLVATLMALIPGVARAYTLGPSDEMNVIIRTPQTESTAHLAVTVDGRIYVPPAGAFTAQGKTPAELETELARGLAKYLVGPVQVTILVTQLKNIKLMVLGQVRQPGEQHLLDDRPRLSQAIGAAGGPLPQGALRRVSLVRDGRELGPVDLYAVIKLGRSDLDLEIRPDDRVFVPVREHWVTVLGSVQDPGLYELLDGDRLSDMLRMAGGVTSATDEERATIERHPADGRVVMLKVRPVAAIAQPGGADDPLLAPGDIVRLVSRADQVYVLGEVPVPGPRPFDDSRTVMDYIGAAGGLTARAIPGNVAIVRPGTPENTVIPVDLRQVLAGRSKTPLPELRPGDVIYVPERRISTVQDWTGIGQIIATLIVGARVF